MNKAHLDDSFDIVKQSFLRWLGGDWSVHPMFTGDMTEEEIKQYEAVLRGGDDKCEIKLISTEQLSKNAGWYKTCMNCGNLFLDPDTGLATSNGKKGNKYLLLNDLVAIVKACSRKDCLTMVFDQSIGHASPDARKKQMEDKIKELKKSDVYAFAYVSQCCILVAGQDKETVQKSLKNVLECSGLPRNRFVAWCDLK